MLEGMFGQSAKKATQPPEKTRELLVVGGKS
jgi:hypothetical protein